MSLSSFSVDSCFNKSTWCLLLVLLLLLLLLLPSCVWEQESDTPETLKLLLVTGQKLEAGGSISQFKLCQRDINTVTCSVHMFLHIVFHVHMFCPHISAHCVSCSHVLHLSGQRLSLLCILRYSTTLPSNWWCNNLQLLSVCVCVCVCVCVTADRACHHSSTFWLINISL